MFGAAAACRAKYRRSAVRAEAPPRGGSQNSPRGLRHENNTAPTEAKLANLNQRALFLNEANAACGGEPGDSRSGEPPRREAAAHATLRIAKPQNHRNRRKTRPKNNYSFNPTASLRRQRTAESTNHTDKSRSPCHSGCEVAVERRYR